MNRISTGLSVAVVGGILASLVFGPGQTTTDGPSRSPHKPDFSAAEIDRTPVGTAKRITRVKLDRQASR